MGYPTVAAAQETRYGHPLNPGRTLSVTVETTKVTLRRMFNAREEPPALIANDVRHKQPAPPQRYEGVVPWPFHHQMTSTALQAKD